MTTTPHTTKPSSQDEHTNDTSSAADSAVDLATHGDAIEASMATITDILTNPTAELFHTHRADIIRLLTTISHTDTLYAAFAYAAHEAGVSRVVGTTRTSTYLARLLDTSEYQARQWITLGISLYKPPEPPTDKTTTTVDDLKLNLRTQVRTLNSTVVDPTADYRARTLVWSPAATPTAPSTSPPCSQGLGTHCWKP